MPCKICLKIFMIVCNTALLLGGAALLAIGGLIEVTKKHILGALEGNIVIPQLSQLANASYLMIGVGGVIAFVGFLGCCGAYYENKWLLKMFFKIISNVFITEVVTALLLLLDRPTAEKYLEIYSKEVASRLKTIYNKDDIINKAWNQTMSLMECCGFNNYTDYTDSEFVKQNSLYPSFCCRKEQSEPCDLKAAKSAGVKGCFDVVVNWVNFKSKLLGQVTLCIAAIQVAAMIASRKLTQS